MCVGKPVASRTWLQAVGWAQAPTHWVPCVSAGIGGGEPWEVCEHGCPGQGRGGPVTMGGPSASVARRL